MRKDGKVIAREPRFLTPRQKGKIASFLHLCDLTRAYPDEAPPNARKEIERVAAECRSGQAA